MGVYLRGKVWYLDFYYGGHRYTESVGPVNKSVAKEKLIIRQREVIQDQYKPKAIKVPFDKFSEQYLDYSQNNKKPKSFVRDETSMKHLLVFFKGKLLSDICSLELERYKKKRKEEGAKEATINRELACLSNLFTKAIAWKKATSNPKKGVKSFPEPRGKDRILSEEEEERLFQAVRSTTKSQHLEPIIITALTTGMRKSEILNLKWSNVDFRKGFITVEETITKNGEIKMIPMNRKLTETLKNVKVTGDYVFSRNGKPFTDVKTGWWTALRKAKIEGLTFHGLRHTFGSRLVMAGVDIVTVKELLGHKDIKMTMRYSHPTPEHKRKAVELLSESQHFSQQTPQIERQANVVSIGNY